jgi:hypothetical protein
MISHFRENWKRHFRFNLLHTSFSSDLINAITAKIVRFCFFYMNYPKQKNVQNKPTGMTVHRLGQERPSLEPLNQERPRLERHSSNVTKPRTTKPGMTTGLESDQVSNGTIIFRKNNLEWNVYCCHQSKVENPLAFETNVNINFTKYKLTFL